MSRCDAGCPEHTCCPELWDRIAELESHNLEYALHEQKLKADLKASQSDCKRVEVALKKVSDYVLRVEGERDRLMELIYKFSALEALIPPTKGDEK